MQLTDAKKMHAAFTGVDIDHYHLADMRFAVEQTRRFVESYKAPHAYRGSIAKPRRRISSVLMPRLFKGHRP